MSAVTHVSVVIPMYRSGPLTVSIVTALNGCYLPDGFVLGVIVVDDASGDGGGHLVEALGHTNVRVVTLAKNAGRSAARNRGAADAPEGLILFLDSDCIPSAPDFLEAHLATLGRGAAVSMGAVDGASDGFWHDYQAAAARRRTRASEQGGVALYGSSQNFMLSRELFLSVGAFDEGYRGYGFEDRDLFLRIEQTGRRVAWSADARVVHRDRLRLRTVCMKMAEAGGAPAMRFHEKHPAAYQQLGYGKLDARHRQWLRLLEPFSTLVVRGAVPWMENRLDKGPLPLSWRMKLVRLLIAASYVHGTVRQDDQAFLRT